MTWVPYVHRRNHWAQPAHRVSASLAVSAVVTALTLGTAFGLLALGVEAFWVAYPLGFGVILPTALGFVNHNCRSRKVEDHHRSGNGSRDRLEDLRDRYVRGEITEAEFERQLDRLLEINERQ